MMLRSLLLSVFVVALVQAAIILNPRGYLRFRDRNGNHNINSGTANEGAYDNVTRFVYVTGRDQQVLHVIDITNVDNPIEIKTIQFDETPLDVEVCRGVGRPKLAVSFENPESIVLEGKVKIYDPITSAADDLGPPLFDETVGAHPENIKFTPDCLKIVVANEGIAAEREGTFIDPEGTVEILEFTSDTVITDYSINFHAVNDPAERDRLLGLGVRFVLRNLPTGTNDFSRDMQPEYVSISKNGAFAWVSLEENNAIAKIDLNLHNLVSIYPMGEKNWNTYQLDASDRDGNNPGGFYNIKSFYQPDRIFIFEWHGKQYLVSADEGAYTDHPSIMFSDNAQASSVSTMFEVDPELQSQLETNSQLGRLFVSIEDGKVSSGNIGTVYMFGGRGFSVFDATTMSRKYESADYTERNDHTFFNSVLNCKYSSRSQTPVGDRDRNSPLLGAELNSVSVGEVLGETCMFFGNGQCGVLYVYCLNPAVNETVSPLFHSTIRRGNVDFTWDNAYNGDQMGDIGITDIELITNHISGVPILVVISSISGSMSVYSIEQGHFPSYLGR